MALVPWIIGLCETLAGRILAALGIGWITYSAVTTTADSLKTNFLEKFGSLPSDILQLFGLAGIDEAFGIILGAFVSKAALSALPKLGKLVSS